MRFLFVLTFTFWGLTACDDKKVSNLEQQVQGFKEQLEQGADTRTAGQLKKEDIAKQRAHIREKEVEESKLFAELEKTTNKEECEKIKTKIKELRKEVEKLISEYQMAGAWRMKKIAGCGKTGYDVYGL